MTAAREHVIADLRDRISALSGSGARKSGCLPFGLGEVDQVLPGGRPFLRRPTRVRRWRRWNRRWRSSCVVLCGDRRQDQREDHLVLNAPGPVLSVAGSSRFASQSGRLCRSRPRRGCACDDGGGAVLWRPGSGGGGTRPVADAGEQAIAAGRREDRDNGIGGPPVAATNRSE